MRLLVVTALLLSACSLPINLEDKRISPEVLQTHLQSLAQAVVTNSKAFNDLEARVKKLEEKKK